MRSVIPTRSSRAPGALQTAALLGVAGLAASLLYVQARQRGVQQQHPAQGRFVDVDGVRLHYVERGEGPALILLHGNGMIPDDVNLGGLQAGASRPYRMIAFDRPGFGYSERPGQRQWTPEEQARLFYKALHQIGVERPIVIGHGWGSLVALAMALEFPRYVRAITLVSGAYYPGAHADLAPLSTPSVPGLGSLLRHTVAPLLGRLLWPRLVERMFAPAPVPAQVAHLPKWMALRPSQLAASAAEATMLEPSAKRLAARYRELTLPIAVIAGGGDRFVDADRNALRFHQEVPHSELIVEDAVGHMPHYADAGRMMEAVERLEASLAPGGVNMRLPAALPGSATLH